MENILHEEFDSKVLKNGNKTIVLFYASWCPYCTNFKPTFESFKIDNANKFGALIDEDENPLWDRFNIKLVPTVIVFENGKIIARRDAKNYVGLTKSDMDSIMKQLD